MENNVGKCAIASCVCCVLVSILAGIRKVDQLEMCLTYNWLTESVADDVMTTPGLRFRHPWSYRICYPKTNKYLYWRKSLIVSQQGDIYRGPLAVRTQDGLAIQIEMEFAYTLIPERLRDLYMLVGPPGFQKQLVHLSEGILDNEATRFTAQEFFENRTMIQNEFQKALTAQLDAPLGMKVTTLQLQPAHFPVAYSQAITDTQVMTQDILVATQEQLTTKVDKETDLQQATKLAESRTIGAEAVAINIALQSDAHMDQFVYRQEQDAVGYRAVYDFFTNSGDFLSYLSALVVSEHNSDKMTMRLTESPGVMPAPPVSTR